MANSFSRRGFRPVGTLNSGKIAIRRYRCITTTPIYVNNIVQLAASGKVKTMTTAGGAWGIVGVAATYGGTANTTGVDVYDDPMTVFEVRLDGTTDPGATTALSLIGETGNVNLSTGDTTTKLSKHQFDYSDHGTDTTAPLKIIGYSKNIKNDQNSAQALALVRLQRHINLTKYSAGA